MRALLVVVLLATAAWAFKPGDSLWVRDEGTVLLKEANDASKPVLTLKAGEQVKWLGPSEKDRAFHLVNARGKPGYVRITALSPHGPEGASNASSFESATVKLEYGARSTAKPTSDAGVQAITDLAAVEELNRQVSTSKR